MKQAYIDADIKKSATLPTSFYKDPAVFEAAKEAIFAPSWQVACDAKDIAKKGSVYPFEFLSPTLPEPLLFSRDHKGTLNCLSNVCTHRGNILVTEPGQKRVLSCGYHGRCFGLDGKFRSMPEFECVENFPTEKDNLANLSHGKLGPLHFASLAPKHSFDEVFGAMLDRIGWMPLDSLKLFPEHSKDYEVNAHWALYCDNFLEGFHIPYVHPALNEALDFGAYTYELFPFSNLQLGVAKEGEPCFDIPEGSVDYGKRIYAYYFWVFPNLMFNFYPWGLSLNIVRPLSIDKTAIHFRNYRFEDAEFDQTVHNLDNTEMEDEAVVEQVQKGIQSRFYTKGRFSPTMEQGVHHFHQLVNTFLKG